MLSGSNFELLHAAIKGHAAAYVSIHEKLVPRLDWLRGGFFVCFGSVKCGKVVVFQKHIVYVIAILGSAKREMNTPQSRTPCGDLKAGNFKFGRDVYWFSVILQLLRWLRKVSA